MFSNQDDRNGLIKTTWRHIRERVAKVEPTFARIVDDIDPDDSFPIYLAYYPYGTFIGDTQSIYLPKMDGGLFKLSDKDVPKDIAKHLGYGKNSAPMGMVLDKNIEWFIDLKEDRASIPWVIYEPGTFFPLSRILSKKRNRMYAPNGVLLTTSGARSTFMLPNIGCAVNHSNLQRDFNVQSSPPKTLYEHWHVFKEIVNSKVINCDWRSCLIYFSEKWEEKLLGDGGWSVLRMYLYELAWYRFEYERNRIYYDIAFSIIQNKRNLKPNPYLADTARHLFTTAMGATPGYIPSIDEHFIPLELLQKAFVGSYGLKKYNPTIMQPTIFNFENDTLPIYYSLQNPSTYFFSPKSRKMSSTLFEMRELEHIMRIFIEELSKRNNICSNTIVHIIANQVEFDYFHNKIDRHKIVKLSSNMEKHDPRFSYISHKHSLSDGLFASDAPFSRGCISIKRKLT